MPNARLHEVPSEPDRLYRLSELKPLTGMSRSKTYALMAAGSFPKPVRVGRTLVWASTDIAQWQKSLRSSAK